MNPANPSSPSRPSSFPSPSSANRHWDLEPGTVFLNHGSFGACPRAALEVQAGLRRRMEGEPVRFFVEEYRGLMDESRRALAAFLDCEWDCLAPISNATTAVATILRHLEEARAIGAGDEILTNDHEYPACQNILRATAARVGAKVVTATLPFPCADEGEVAEAILSRVSERTRLVLVSHVTSPSGMVLPVERIVGALRERGASREILTLVDGAHAPGMVASLNLRELRPTFYTANCHKWLCTPKGSAFLYVDLAWRGAFRPLVLSNNAEKPIAGRAQFLTEFDYQGTTDQTAFMSIPGSLRVMAQIARETFGLPSGTPDLDAWRAIMAHNHALALRGREIICDALGVKAAAPDTMIGSIATIVLPQISAERLAELRARPTKYHDALQDAMIRNWKIQVPVWSVPDRPLRTLRISAQLYNSVEQYEYLARAVVGELGRE